MFLMMQNVTMVQLTQKNFKSIYIVLQTWIEPIQDEENWKNNGDNKKTNTTHIIRSC
jgi:hypothetical protein